MNTQKQITALNHLYSRLDNSINKLKISSGLNCPAGCGMCCLKNDIQASSTEFLPLAVDLLKQGTAETWYDKAIADTSGVCVLFTGVPQQSCTQYENRGLICRLFGYAALRNKYGVPGISACKVLKGTPAFDSASKYFTSHKKGPLIDEYYLKLAAIGGRFPLEYFPINKAIGKALENILMRDQWKRGCAA